jgi:hypothetical protein
MKSGLARAVALLCAVVCATVGSSPCALVDCLSVLSRAGADTYRNDHGDLVERHLDTNGDGRADVVEYYANGVLLRRDSDRDFNGVTDLVEDFDAQTQQRVRLIVDQDYDGTADLLLLFRDGQAVVSERASRSENRRRESAAIGGSATAPLVSLKSWFGATSAYDTPVQPVRETWFGAARAKGLLVSGAAVRFALDLSRPLGSVERTERTTDLSLRPSRGPPQA